MNESFNSRAWKVLVADPVGLLAGNAGAALHEEVARYAEASGCTFQPGPCPVDADLARGQIHFFYVPDISRADEILPLAGDGAYDGLIAAATFIPQEARFEEGGVRIGAGTANMGSLSWGGGDGIGGVAPLMNTPSFNSRATAQMVAKVILRVLPDLPLEVLHDMVCRGEFDTGRDLSRFPTRKLEGLTLALFGYGNIGREVARIMSGFGIRCRIFARQRHQSWIEAEGHEWAASPVEAARGADILSPHTGLGAQDEKTGRFANEGLVGADVLDALNPGAVLVNFDRGEVVDAKALGAALGSGRLRHAAIDADLFKDAESGELSGPMVPYLDLLKDHADRLLLLPHAAADTEHVSRVEGAKQAVEQMISAIRDRRVINLKGDLPEGYVDAGPVTVSGVGSVGDYQIDRFADNAALKDEARELAGKIAELLDNRTPLSGSDNRSELIMSINRLNTLCEENGLLGPYYG